MKHVWASSKIVSSPFENIVVPDMPISEYVWTNVEKWSNKTAMVCAVTNRKYTYNEIYKQSRTFAANLRKKFDIKDGDPVIVMLPNIPEYATVTLGVLTAGGLVSTLNPIYTTYEVQRQVSMSRPKLAIAVPETAQTLNEALKQNNLNTPIVVVDTFHDRPNDTVSFKEIVENDIDLDILKDVRRTGDDVSLLLYSSGTTGLPKGVELTNKNIIANCEQQNVTNIQYHTDTSDSNQDTILAYLPFFHSYGMSVNLIHKLSVGLQILTLPKFQPNTFLDAFDRFKINMIYMVPPTVFFLATSPEVKPEYFEKLRCATTGGAPVAMADIHRFLDKIGHEIHFGQAYGLTETGPLATLAPVGLKEYTSVGCALSNVELRVVDDQLNNLGPNELGELLIKGPNVMKGYKNNEEANRQTFIDGDWFRTGDQAKINENGRVYVADRLKELIKVNAYQVPPAELESLLKEHPAILDAAVIGIPDKVTGEKPKAFIILNKGANVTEKTVMDYVSERVSPYKRLKEVQFVETIHKNPTGKILRRLLREEHSKK
ncbi:unnamed protein product, partial [Brenthis ino]